MSDPNKKHSYAYDSCKNAEYIQAFVTLRRPFTDEELPEIIQYQKNFFNLKSYERKPNVLINKYHTGANVYPLYCTVCGKCQDDMYIHNGSRYGFVMTVQCDKCSHDITVLDHDYVFYSMCINSKENEIFFEDLYCLSDMYLFALSDKFGININSILQYFNDQYHVQTNESRGYIRPVPINEFREYFENITGVKTDGTMKFTTSPHFDKLPHQINQWIEFLYRCNITNENIKKL